MLLCYMLFLCAFRSCMDLDKPLRQRIVEKLSFSENEMSGGFNLINVVSPSNISYDGPVVCAAADSVRRLPLKRRSSRKSIVHVSDSTSFEVSCSSQIDFLKSNKKNDSKCVNGSKKECFTAPYMTRAVRGNILVTDVSNLVSELNSCQNTFGQDLSVPLTEQNYGEKRLLSVFDTGDQKTVGKIILEESCESSLINEEVKYDVVPESKIAKLEISDGNLQLIASSCCDSSVLQSNGHKFLQNDSYAVSLNTSDCFTLLPVTEMVSSDLPHNKSDISVYNFTQLLVPSYTSPTVLMSMSEGSLVPSVGEKALISDQVALVYDSSLHSLSTNVSIETLEVQLANNSVSNIVSHVDATTMTTEILSCEDLAETGEDYDNGNCIKQSSSMQPCELLPFFLSAYSDKPFMPIAQ